MKNRKTILAGGLAALAITGLAIKAKADGAEERVATIVHIMNGLTKPSMGKIKTATTTPPATDKDWRDVETAAAVLNETSFILMEGGRAKDDVWSKACTDMRTGSADIVKAAGAKDAEAIKAGAAKIGGSCKACHDVHQKM